MLWEMFEGLMMDLASDTDEQRTLLPAEVTVNTRCLAMLATPTRERAAGRKRLINIKQTLANRELTT